MALDQKCPGAKQFTQATAEFLDCPHCGAEVEIWSDESQTKCDACGKVVPRPRTQGCIDHCDHAKECLGPELYEKLVLAKGSK